MGPRPDRRPEKLESAQAALESAGWTTTWQPGRPPPQASGTLQEELRALQHEAGLAIGTGRHSAGWPGAVHSFSQRWRGRAGAAASAWSPPSLRGVAIMLKQRSRLRQPPTKDQGWADHRSRDRALGPGHVAPACQEGSASPRTPQLTGWASSARGPHGQPLQHSQPLPGPTTGIFNIAPRPTPSGDPQSTQVHRGQAGRVSRAGSGGYPGHLEVAASARGLLTSCGVDAVQTQGRAPGRAPCRGPSPACHRGKAGSARPGR